MKCVRGVGSGKVREPGLKLGPPKALHVATIKYLYANNTLFFVFVCCLEDILI